MGTTMGPLDAFEASRVKFEEILGALSGGDAAGMTHAELEDHLSSAGRALLRQLYQDHLDLRARRELRVVEVRPARGAAHRYAEADHCRSLATVFGEVTCSRLAYRRKAEANLHPADALLNLPAELHSHGLRRLGAIEVSRGSYDEAAASIETSTGVRVGSRQLEHLVGRAAVDFEAFYDQRPRPAAQSGEVVVLSVDGKGVVMRPGSLRPETAAAAARADPKLETRLSRGEKRNRKRMAEVGAVYTVEPVPRSPEQIMAHDDDGATKKQAPKASRKWLTASVADDAASVIARVFDEAERRDPDHCHDWVALVDGNNHQIERIKAEAADRGITISVVIDIVHVLEYLWKAAWSFFSEGDRQAEAFVAKQALAVLEGKASVVAGAIRRKATMLGLDAAARKNADTCADYLLAKAPYLDYPAALAKGWPVATGIIEGACRHLVKDRMDLTGARWGLDGAESVLRLRALRSNGDFDGYWSFHLAQERRRVHESRYDGGVIPQVA